jgi:hypothetical protein
MDISAGLKSFFFRDVVVSFHGSATQSDITEFKFDGTRYQRSACYKANSDYLGNDGEYYNLNELHISPCKCR